jgi:hypothetical protein
MRANLSGTVTSRLGRRLAMGMAALTVGAMLCLGSSPPVGAAPADDVQPAVEIRVRVWADSVNVRSCASTGCSRVHQINHGWYPYSCTMRGQRVTYGSYTNIYWTRIWVDTDGNGYYETPGFVSDVFVAGGGNDQPAQQPTTWCG